MTHTGIPLSIKRVLVLEDNYIIAMEAEDILLSLGIEQVHIATNIAQATTIIGIEEIDFALLDVDLGGTTSFGFADILRQRGTPFGFVSGYGDDSAFPAEMRDTPRISKPFNDGSVQQLLSAVFA